MDQLLISNRNIFLALLRACSKENLIIEFTYLPQIIALVNNLYAIAIKIPCCNQCNLSKTYKLNRLSS